MDEQRERPQVGMIRMSYLIQPCGLDGREINGGMHYSNADSAEDARATAEQMIRAGVYLEYTLGKVTVYGQEMCLGYSGWAPVPGGRTEYFEVTRADVGANPVFLHHDQTRCYDTTVMDYFETVHAMKTDGSCQCGDPTRNVRH